MLFYKMNGLGNDYIFIDSSKCLKQDFEYLKRNIRAFTIKLSDRHFGVGGDGVVLLEESKMADIKMRIFNADGSEGKMCGNALRCIGKLLHDGANKIRNEYYVETLSGIKLIEILNNDTYESLVLTRMGRPKLTSIKDNVEFYDIGNKHAVFYTETLDDFTIEKASVLSKTFDVNAEAVMIDGESIKMRVWERGSGETLACGTGATCVAQSIFEKGLFKKSELEIFLKGGCLVALNDKEGISLIGKANLNYIGEINLRNYG